MFRSTRALVALVLLAAGCDDTEVLRVQGDLQISPLTLDFGDVVVGEIATLELDLKAMGLPEVELESVEIEPAGDTFLFVQRAPSRVSAEGRTLEIGFAPGAAEDYVAVLSFVVGTDVKTPQQQVQLRGRGLERGLALEYDGPSCDRANSASFGLVARGGEGRLEVAVASTGNAPVTVEDIVVDSGASREIELVSPSQVGQVIEPGASLPVVLRYRPQDNGEDLGIVTVHTREGASLRFRVCGTGVAVSICAAPDPLDFGLVAERVPITRQVRLTACGEEPLRITAVGIADDANHPANSDFVSVYLDPLGRDIPAGDFVDVDVTFTPTAQGSAQAWLLVESNAPETPEIFVGLVGQGLPPCQLVALPENLRFIGVPVGSTDSRRALLVNDEPSRCRVPRLEVTGPAAARFSVSAAGRTPLVLEPGTSQTVTVEYTPTIAGQFDVATLEAEMDGQFVAQVGLTGTTEIGPGCQLDVRPAFVSFGVVTVGEPQRRGVVLENRSPTATCNLLGVAFTAGASGDFALRPPVAATLGPNQSVTIEVDYAPTVEGADTATVRISSDDGDDPQIDVPVHGNARQPLICVTPASIDFGLTQMTTQLRTVTVTACGPREVTVSAIDWPRPDSEYNLMLSTPPPWTIPSGGAVTFDVQYVPADAFADWATLAVHSDDPLRPQVPIEVRGGPDEFPPEVGRNLYIWQNGTVVRYPLQGNMPSVPFWGQQTGRGCTGCHAVSPDGRYVALIDYPTFNLVDTTTNQVVPTTLAGNIEYISWNPNPNTTPSHQFVYSDGTGRVFKASATGGPLGMLAGASDPAFNQRMPSWGPNGQIAFARGAANTVGAPFGFQGAVDLMLVPEGGGVATPVVGASGGTPARYYPAFSPTGQWIAFTYSPSAMTTYAAADAQIHLVKADQSGIVRTLPAANVAGSAASYPSWSLDGRVLSFSSNRTGGVGDWDIYVAGVDPVTGMSGAAQILQNVNTGSFDHLAVWSR